MINIFNRKELLITQSVEKYANARDDLKENNIKFLPKIKSVYGVPQRKVGVMQMGKRRVAEYTIYVHEKDFDKALAVIHDKV